MRAKSFIILLVTMTVISCSSDVLEPTDEPDLSQLQLEIIGTTGWVAPSKMIEIYKSGWAKVPLYTGVQITDDTALVMTTDEVELFSRVENDFSLYTITNPIGGTSTDVPYYEFIKVSAAETLKFNDAPGVIMPVDIRDALEFMREIQCRALSCSSDPDFSQQQFDISRSGEAIPVWLDIYRSGWVKIFIAEDFVTKGEPDTIIQMTSHQMQIMRFVELDFASYEDYYPDDLCNVDGDFIYSVQLLEGERDAVMTCGYTNEAIPPSLSDGVRTMSEIIELAWGSR